MIKTFILAFVTMFICTGHVFAEIAEESEPTKRFPPKYSGDDIAIVVSKLKKINSKMGRKSEFESFEEYKARVDKFAKTTDVEKNLSIVIKPNNIKTEYDADNKHLTFTIAEDPALKYDSNFLLKNTDKKTGSFVVMNGFGAKIKVTKFRRSIVKFVPNRVTCADQIFGSESEPTRNYLTLTVDSETAKRMKNNIAVLYTASPAPPYYKHANEKYPLYAVKYGYLPVDIDSTEDIIYADINKITFFNYKTGEVFLEYDLDNHNCEPGQKEYLPG